MRILTAASLIVAAGLMLAASVQPGAAMVIYPWCANYGGGGKGGYGASSCGFVSFKQCLATMWATEEAAIQIRGIRRILHRRPMLRPSGGS